MKSEKKILLIVGILIAVVAASLWGIVKYENPFADHFGSIGTVGYSDSDLKNENYLDLNQEKTFAVEKLNIVDLKIISEDVKIIPVDSKEIKVHFYGTVKGFGEKNSPKLFITNNDGGFTAAIKYKNNFHSNIGSYNGKVDVYVPKNFNGTIQVNGVSSNVNIGDYKLDNLSCKTVSGDINTENVKARIAEFKSVSGDIDLNNFNGDVNFNTTSGDAKIIYDKFSNNIKGNTVSGDINIQLPNTSEFNFKGNTVSGNVDCDFDGDKTSKEKRHFMITVGSSKNNIDLNTVSGHMKVYH